MAPANARRRKTGRWEASVDLGEATRQLAQAAHDAQVASACISLATSTGRTSAIIGRAEADAAENVQRAELNCGDDVPRDQRRAPV